MVRAKPDVDTAFRILRDHAPELPAEMVPAFAASGRVVATPPLAQLPVPRFRASAMDGFALAGDFTSAASADDPVHMLVVERYGAAGVSPGSLRAGEAARIATGAPVPDGADAVLIKERAVSTMVGGGRRLSLTTPVPAGSNIRLPGEDVPAGAPLMARGRLISPAGIGLMVAAGVPEVEVRRWPRVRLVSTGSELAADAASLDHPARIPDSNGPMLMAALREIGLPYHSCHHAADQADKLEESMVDQDADIFISTGGVSAGDFDLIPGTLEKLGATIHFNGVSMRPGKPILFATLPDDRPFLGLPGNPVAAAVAFRFFFGALLREMLRVPIEAGIPIKTRIPRRPGTTLFLRGRAHHDDYGALGIELEGDQRSHILSSVVAADSWIRVDGDETRAPLLFSQLLSLRS